MEIADGVGKLANVDNLRFLYYKKFPKVKNLQVKT